MASALSSSNARTSGGYSPADISGYTAAGYSQGTALAPVERGAIVQSIVDAVNANGETGIRSNASVSQRARHTSPGGRTNPPLRPISELASTIDGFEWVIEPLEYTAGKVGDFMTYGTLGTFQRARRV